MKQRRFQLAVMLCLVAGNSQAAPVSFALFDTSSVLQVQHLRLPPEAPREFGRKVVREFREFYGHLQPKRMGDDVRLHYRGVITQEQLQADLKKIREDLEPVVCSILRARHETPSSCLGERDGNR